jgi:hypothetical protein
MTPKSGTFCTLKEPKAPVDAEEAADAEPGEAMDVAARQRQAEETELGPADIGAMQTTEEEADEQETHWISIELKDSAGNPMPDEQYRVKLPDGSIRTGYLDDKGKAREDGIPTGGQCEINFPRLHGDDWQSQG